MSSYQIDYSGKRVLLVESSGNMRATIVHMLRHLGVVNIQAMTVNDQVLDLVREERFDIVLLGHNSSDYVSGLQLLEEARFKGLIAVDSCWILMTCDASQEVILHAIESQPDALLSKPFTIEELKARLDLLMFRKAALVEVDQAIIKGQLDKAVKLCDQVELSGKHYDYVQLLKGRLLLQMNRFKEAEQFFQYRFKHYQEKESGLGLAEAYIGQEQYQQAEKLLLYLVRHYPLLLSASDLLAVVQERLGALMPAQETLNSAVRKSPLTLSRHMELGRIAVHTRTLPLAETAYRKSISLGKHSCFRSAEPFVRLANVHRLEMEDASPGERIELRNRFDEVLNHAAFQFPKDKLLKLKTCLLQSQLSQDLGEKDQANRYLLKAQQQAQEMNLGIDLQHLMQDVKGNAMPLPEQDEKAAPLVTREQDPQMSQRVNRLGVKHYLAGQMGQAIRYFGLAIEHDPKNSRALLNLAQLFIESAKLQKARREERMKMVQRYLRLAGRMPLTEQERAKYQHLSQLSETPLEQLPASHLGALLR